MALVLPAPSTCAGRMTVGERRLAERLEAKLDKDYLVWYDVPIGPRAMDILRHAGGVRIVADTGGVGDAVRSRLDRMRSDLAF